MKPSALALRKPSFVELTAAAVMATGLWLAALALSYAIGQPLGRGDAGALLLVVAWGCVSVRVGLDIGRGGPHLAAHVLVSALLLGGYETVRWLVA